MKAGGRRGCEGEAHGDGRRKAFYLHEAFRALYRKLMWTSSGCVFVNVYLKQVGTENIVMLLIFISLTESRADELLLLFFI